MNARLLILVLLCIFSFCCYKEPEPELELSDGEKGWLKKVMSTPLIFSVPNEKAEIVWGRIQSFIGTFSPLKIQVATDYVIQTYSGDFAYSATRTPGETETMFSVICSVEAGWFGNANKAELNSHILAYTALTGEAVFWLMMERYSKRIRKV
jgi:hypothetical protein